MPVTQMYVLSGAHVREPLAPSQPRSCSLRTCSEAPHSSILKAWEEQSQ